jgi:hypothetical protein
MKRLSVLFVSVCCASGLLWAVQAHERDEVRIESVNPPGPVTRGVETEFTIDVVADLESDDDGMTMVGFNTESPTVFKMLDSHLVKHGKNRFSFKVRAVPADWGEHAKFAVQVNMGGKPEGSTWRPTATSKQSIEVEP